MGQTTSPVRCYSIYIIVVSDLRNFTVGVLKGLSLGNSREFILTRLHTLTADPQMVPISLKWEGRNFSGTRHPESHQLLLQTFAKYALGNSPVDSTALWTVVAYGFQFEKDTLVVLVGKLEHAENLCNSISFFSRILFKYLKLNLGQNNGPSPHQECQIK